MRPVYYKSEDSYFKGLQKDSDIYNLTGYIGIELQTFKFEIYTKRMHFEEELKRYWNLSSEEEFNEALIKITEHLKGL